MNQMLLRHYVQFGDTVLRTETQLIFIIIPYANNVDFDWSIACKKFSIYVIMTSYLQIILDICRYEGSGYNVLPTNNSFYNC